MAEAGLDALVITSSAVGQWFTSAAEPHEWHDQLPGPLAWYILTPMDDYLFMTPTTAGEHMNTTRRSTWVTHILPIVERAAVAARRAVGSGADAADLRATRSGAGRLGFELGDCMTLGVSVNDFLALRDLMPDAACRRLAGHSPADERPHPLRDRAHPQGV